MLVCFDGLPVLDPEWWKGLLPRHYVLRFSDCIKGSSLPVTAEVLDSLRQDCQRRGKDLLLVASPDANFAMLKGSVQLLGIVTNHPQSAYYASGRSGSMSLNDYSAGLLRFLDVDSSIPVTEASLLPDFLTKDCAYLNPASVDWESRPLSEVSPFLYYGKSPEYEKLCNRLGYQPDRVSVRFPLPDTAAKPVRMPVAGSIESTKLTRASWFLVQLCNMPGSGCAVEQMASLIPQIDHCLTAPDIWEALDSFVATLDATNQALVYLVVAAHFHTLANNLQALGLITEAIEAMPKDRQDIQQIAAALYATMGKSETAITTLGSGLMEEGALDIDMAHKLSKTMRGNVPVAMLHGHQLLIDVLTQSPPSPAPHRRLMVEIGTTREAIPGQGSTRKLAELCAHLNIDFITVDMDPANTRRAQRTFQRFGFPFTAITAKGEEYLAAFSGRIDYIFLDAYDFDHGKHSEFRQDRYIRFLGNRIDETACHQMHLECAEALLTRLTSDGLICFDDTWLDDAGNWTAKGTTAMPFLLKNGFEIVQAKNHAALLRQALWPKVVQEN